MRRGLLAGGAVLALAAGILLTLPGCDDEPWPELYAGALPLGATLDGDTLTTAAFRDHVLLVLFWATWCTPCDPAFTDLDTLWTALSSQGAFEIVAVDLDAIDGALEAYLQDQDHEFTITRDSGLGTANAFEVHGIPAYSLLDARGAIRWSAVGYQSMDVIEAEVAKVANQSSTRIVFE